MALNVNRWLKYAKSRIDAAVRSGNDELDDLEARREAERADKPWLSDHDSDSVSPSMDQVRARIEWEAERQGVDAPRSGGGVPDRPDSPPETEAPAADDAGATTPADDAKPDGDGGDEPTEAGSTAAGAGGSQAEPSGSTPAPRSPEEQTADAEREMARLELEARQKASAQRLDDIRKELGVDPPPPDAPAE